MNETIVIERSVADGVMSVDVQVVTLELPSQIQVVACGEQGPPGVTTAVVGAPASSSATGTAGEVRVDAGFIYLCVADNTWQRAAITTF
jgi:hypothetical protein